MSYRQAAQKFGVRKSTVRDRITGRVDEDSTPGKKPVLPLAIEEELAKSINNAASKGFGITRLQLQTKVKILTQTLNLKTPFKNGIPGKDWLSAFQKRHGLSVRKPQPLSGVRARVLNPAVVTAYFDDLKKVVAELGLAEKPQAIWNMDETNVSLTHKPPKVLAKSGVKNVPGRVGDSRESVRIRV